LVINHLQKIDKPFLQNILTFNRGIERETLRLTSNGLLATSNHPKAFGSKLTHPKITTDFSEAQLELITPVHSSSKSAIKDLDQIHRYLYQEIDQELLWAASMPCVLPDDDKIPLAYYGKSNLGNLKTTYRSGLGYRYGRAMQTICAVHYNFSFTESFWKWLKHFEKSNEPDNDFITRRYFDLMRNFRQCSWLLTYLFGASPAVCNSFVGDRDHGLTKFDPDTSYLPHATSLRSGNLGYQSDAQAEHMEVCYNSLDTYISSLASAIRDEYPPYKEIGVQVGKQYRQINTSILQSEAEFYSSIRAKRVPEPGENFLTCLHRNGVQYVEIRLLDVNPYLPLGIDETEINFLDTFLLYCLLKNSPEHNQVTCQEVGQNAMTTVNQGRSSELILTDNGCRRSIKEWGHEILSDMAPHAGILDRTFNTDRYQTSLNIQQQRIKNPNSTPSGQIISDMEEQEKSFLNFAMDQTLKHRKNFKSRPLSSNELTEFADIARQSLEDQKNIEAADDKDFNQYLIDTLALYQEV
tara:strand:- start:62 stop:1630 length:1569 start_codon:yes stop_codon:yes gene_type:complete